MALPITLGADPEFFLESTLSGQLKSAVEQIGGSKEFPRPLGSPGFFVQEDNVAVEFNIPPAKTLKAFLQSMDFSIRTITDEVEKKHLRPKFSAAEIFPMPELMHPKAMEFGCDPDYNAWNAGAMNPRPHAANPALRSCGGHIHVGIARKIKSEEAKNYCITDIIKAMDLYLGVPSVMMDLATTRRELYGQAGAFRFQSYAPIACEYRVLSNFWINSPEKVTWAYKQSLRAINKVWKMGHKKFSAFLDKEDLSHAIQHCINSSDVELSQRLINDYDLVVV